MWNPRFAALASITLLAALTRLVPHPPNFTPVAAVALFGGAHFAGLLPALAVPLCAMLISDLMIPGAARRISAIRTVR